MQIVTLLALCAVLCCSQGHKQEECLNQHNSLPVLKDITETSKLIQKSLPTDKAHSHRILGNLKKCSRKLSVADFKRILDIYDEHVFQKLWKNNTQLTKNTLLTKNFMATFRRLRDIMEICEPKDTQTLSLCAREDLKKIEATFKTLHSNGLIKAQSEFRNVLVWISNAID